MAKGRIGCVGLTGYSTAKDADEAGKPRAPAHRRTKAVAASVGRLTMAGAVDVRAELASFAPVADVANPGDAATLGLTAGTAGGRGADRVPLLSDVVAEANGFPPRA